MAPRGGHRGRPGRHRRRTTSFFRDDPDNPHHGNRSSHSLKPREERLYQEFHPDLDVNAKLLVLTTTEPNLPYISTPTPSVISQKRKAERPLTPVRTSSRHSIANNGSISHLNGHGTPQTNGMHDVHITTNGVEVNGTTDPSEPPSHDVTPSLVVAIIERSPLQILRQNFAASLPMSRAETNATATQEPEFEVIAPFKDTPYIGRSMADVGYQETEYWSRPEESYLRFYDTTDKELENRVEYDMDEQDDSWLAEYNERRKKDHLEGDEISREIFEVVMTKIEKEWYELEKRIPKNEGKEHVVSEDSTCAICDEGDCENTNAIVFCDGCNLAVHQGRFYLHY